MTAAKSVKILPLGIVFDEKAPPSFKEWQAMGRELVRAEKCLGFYLGDWLNFGERKYGEKYQEAVAATGLDYGTLRQYAHTARRVALLVRTNNLTFAHHCKVAALDPLAQKKWLGIAAQAVEKGEDFGCRRLARSIEAGQVVPLEKIAQASEGASISSYPIYITNINAWWRDLKASGRIPKLTDLQRDAIRESFSLLENTRREMQAEGLWEQDLVVQGEAYAAGPLAKAASG